MELQCLSLKRHLRWNECKRLPVTKVVKKEVQQKKDITADGQDYRSSLPWEEEIDTAGEVKRREGKREEEEERS